MEMPETLQSLWWKVRWSSRATSLLHVLAMYAPFNSWRLFFYRARGTEIGRGVYIVQGCFLEESRPWLIRIEDWVTISAGAMILTHDAFYHFYDGRIPYRYGPVYIKRRATIGPGSIILPGVTIGECAIVAPGSLVRKDVPDRVIVGGNPAEKIMNLDDGLARCYPKIPEYKRVDKLTKYPWVVRKNKNLHPHPNPPPSRGREYI